MMTDLTLPNGFSFGGLACGIKRDSRPDLALVFSETPCTAAALFTQNPYAAAPVIYDRQLLDLNAEGVQAVLINSGNANAVTGVAGLAATRRSAEAVEAIFGLASWSTLVMSTGVIGVPLPVERIETALPVLHQALRPSTDGLRAAAQAIMTTDTRPKMMSVQGAVGGMQVTITGIAKGAGMIHPNMATMLAVLTTDAAISPDVLKLALRRAADQSFNRISVDGDTSTNDTVAILANGIAGNPFITHENTPEFDEFSELLVQVVSPLPRPSSAMAKAPPNSLRSMFLASMMSTRPIVWPTPSPSLPWSKRRSTAAMPTGDGFWLQPAIAKWFSIPRRLS